MGYELPRVQREVELHQEQDDLTSQRTDQARAAEEAGSPGIFIFFICRPPSLLGHNLASSSVSLQQPHYCLGGVAKCTVITADALKWTWGGGGGGGDEMSSC